MDLLYNKKFKFMDEYNQWKLPDLSDWFVQPDEGGAPPQPVAGLRETKRQLDELRSRLDDVELSSWSRHLHFTNRSGIITSALRRDFEPEMCTQVGVVKSSIFPMCPCPSPISLATHQL